MAHRVLRGFALIALAGGVGLPACGSDDKQKAYGDETAGADGSDSGSGGNGLGEAGAGGSSGSGAGGEGGSGRAGAAQNDGGGSGDATIDGGTGGSGGSGGEGGGLGEPLFGGVFWVRHERDSNGDPSAVAEGLFWEPGSALGSVRDWWDDTIGTGFPLAVGECAPRQGLNAPAYTAKTIGADVVIRVNGSDLIVADRLGGDDYWGANDTAAVDQLLSTAFSLAVDPSNTEVPPLVAAGLGPFTEATPLVGGPCTHGTPCSLTVTPAKPVSDFFFAIGTQYVCRGNATTGLVTMSVAALDAVPNGGLNGRVWYYDREEILLGTSPVELIRVTYRVFPVTVQ